MNKIKKDIFLEKIKNWKNVIEKTSSWKYIISILKTIFIVLFLYSSYLVYAMFGVYLLLGITIIIVVSVFLSSLFIFLKIIIKKIKNRRDKDKKNILKKYFKESFFKYLIKFIAILIIIIAMPIVVLKSYNNFYPNKGYMPKIIFENNNEKVVVFQGMQHISSSLFYKQVIADFYTYLSTDFVLFYEEPPINSKTDFNNNTEDTKKLIGGIEKGMEVIYKSVNKICLNDLNSWHGNFVSQYLMDYNLKKIEGLYPGKYIRADIDYQEWFKDIDEKFKDISKKEKKNLKEEFDESEKQINLIVKIADNYDNLKTTQKNILYEFCYLLNNQPIKDYIYIDDDYDRTYSMLVKERDRHLAKKVHEWEGKNIYIAFGAGHISGFYKELKKFDQSWKIKDVFWIPIGKEKKPFKYKINFD